MSPQGNDDDSKASPIGRRTYLGLTAAAAAAAASTGHVGAASSDYETITVGSGERYTHTVRDGEVFENKLIDITASGAGCELGIRVGSGTGVIRNVGVKGVNEAGGANGITPAAENRDGHAVIENVYLGDGGDTRTRHPGIWVDGDDHLGLCTIRNVNVQWFTDNGIYASGPAAQFDAETGGDTIIEGCFARNNNISNFRIGTNDSVIRDSVVVVDSRPRDSGTGTNGRGIWMRGHSTETLAENVDVAQDMGYSAVGTRYSDDRPTLRDSRVKGAISSRVSQENVTNNPSRTPPAGCPTTAEEAASGSSSGSGGSSLDGDPTGDSDLPHGITIEGGSSSSPVDYSFRVTDQVEKTQAYDASVDDADALRSDGVVSGRVTGEADSYAFSGEIAGFSLDGSASIALDGEWLNQGSLGSSDLELPHTLCISGGSASSPATYEFAVSDSVRKTTGCSATIDEDDIISSDGSVSGGVAGGSDSFRFAGDVTSFALDGSATVVLDGQEVDPSTLGSSDDGSSGDGSSGDGSSGDGSSGDDSTDDGSGDGSSGDAASTRALTVTGPQDTTHAEYVFEVAPSQDGTPGIVGTGQAGPGADPDDVIEQLDDGTWRCAGGAALGGTDTFDVTGDITRFESPTGHTFGLELDGQQVDQSTLGSSDDGSSGDGSSGDGSSGDGSTDHSKYVVIDGSGSPLQTNYSFEVTGEVVKDSSRGSVQDSDEIDGSTVDGYVIGGIDAYYYSGTVKNFETDGAVAVTFGSTN